MLYKQLSWNVTKTGKKQLFGHKRPQNNILADIWIHKLIKMVKNGRSDRNVSYHLPLTRLVFVFKSASLETRGQSIGYKTNWKLSPPFLPTRLTVPGSPRMLEALLNGRMFSVSKDATLLQNSVKIVGIEILVANRLVYDHLSSIIRMKWNHSEKTLLSRDWIDRQKTWRENNWLLKHRIRVSWMTL